MLRLCCTFGLLVLLSACAGNNRFVLLEEEDGKVGSIVIENEAGSQTIDTANQVTLVDAATSAPGTPEPISEQEIEETWGVAIQANPLRPTTFILYFILGSDRLTSESEAQLRAVLDAIKEYPAPEVVVVGHTDRLDTAQRNARLALRRAERVRDLLIAEGLAPALIEVDSHGENNPLIPTADEIAEPRNRRVEVTVR